MKTYFLYVKIVCDNNFLEKKTKNIIIINVASTKIYDPKGAQQPRQLSESKMRMIY